MENLRIRTYVDAEHRPAVIALWSETFAHAADHNAPALSIDQKLKADDGLFFVGCAGERVVGTAMAGYDGHRGWLYALAVHPSWRRRGVATRLVRHVEEALAPRGCLKLNLQVSESIGAVASFYQGLGYAVEPRISMGKRLRAGSPASGTPPGERP